MSSTTSWRNQLGADRALALLLAGYTLSFVDRTILGIVQQPIKLELGLSDAELGLLGGTAFALLYSTLGLPIARVAERGGRPRIVAAAVALWSVATIACGAATGFAALFAARVLVGVGEAGGTPPSHAILSSFFAPARRPRAIGIYSLGVPLGILLGAFVGGLVAERLGWRYAFVAVGVPGLLLAPLLLTIREPAPSDAASDRPPLRDVLGFVRKSPAMRNLIAGIVVASFAGYAIVGFLPSLLARSFGLGVSTAGFATGLISGVGGGIGTFAGGWLATRLQTRDPRWIGWVPAIGLLLAALLLAVAFLTRDVRAAIALALVGSVGQFLYLGPTYGAAQSLVPATMRTTTSAIILLFVNAIGLGLGPPLLGWLSDALAVRGEAGAGLARAMACFALLFVWAAWHYRRAGDAIARERTDPSALR